MMYSFSKPRFDDKTHQKSCSLQKEAAWPCRVSWLSFLWSQMPGRKIFCCKAQVKLIQTVDTLLKWQTIPWFSQKEVFVYQLGIFCVQGEGCFWVWNIKIPQSFFSPVSHIVWRDSRPLDLFSSCMWIIPVGLSSSWECAAGFYLCSLKGLYAEGGCQPNCCESAHLISPWQWPQLWLKLKVQLWTTLDFPRYLV